MYRLKSLIIILGLSVVIFASDAMAKVTMTIDRTDISAGETFVIDIQVDEETDQQPDLSRIPKEFTIVSNSQYHHTQIFNGQRNTLKGWKIKLKTLESGEMTIPPITVGNQATQPLTLEIKDSSNQLDLNGQSKVIFLEASVDRDDAYVQQQLIYTVSLYRAVNTHYASLSEPQADNSVVEKLGDDVQFEKYISNRRYIVTQRKYAIFPQQSGKLKISPVNFTADVNDSSKRGRSSFLSATRPISISTQPVEITITPKPASASNPWLPATDVILADKWTPNIKSLKVGEPITWTLLLTVQGLSESQLPEISIPKVEGLQWYYDTPQKERQINDKGIVGQRIEKLAVIPSKEGVVTIPEVKLKWWDVKSNSEKTAVLSTRTFNVLPASEQAQVNVPSPLPQIEDATSVTNTADYQNNLKKWQYAVVGLFALWLITLIAYFRKSPAAPNPERHADPKSRLSENSNAQKVLSELKSSLKSNDLAKIEFQLLRLINLIGYPQIRSLGTLANSIKTESISAKLQSLESQLYSASQQNDYLTLVKSDIDQIIRDLDGQQGKAASSAIPPLYAR